LLSLQLFFSSRAVDLQKGTYSVLKDKGEKNKGMKKGTSFVRFSGAVNLVIKNIKSSGLSKNNARAHMPRFL
jgi:hypothetical protein